MRIIYRMRGKAMRLSSIMKIISAKLILWLHISVQERSLPYF